MNKTVKKDMIAPCGMDCSLCIAAHREKKKCEGCRNIDENKPEGCIKCVIKKCDNLKDTESGFCYDCKVFPCARLKKLDARYRSKYGMSMIKNLHSIKEGGLDAFVEDENRRWRCTNCQSLLCVHRDYCLVCGNKWKEKVAKLESKLEGKQESN